MTAGPWHIPHYLSFVLTMPFKSNDYSEWLQLSDSFEVMLIPIICELHINRKTLDTM